MKDENRGVFISYAHQDTNARRVVAFTQFLRGCLPTKIDILLDRKYLGIGKNIPNFMQRLTTCPVVLILMTPEYKRRCENAHGGVFTEFQIIRERELDNNDDILCLPVLFEGIHSTSVPSLFYDKLYGDFTNFHPRLTYGETNKYYLPDNQLEVVIPKFHEIGNAIESKITVRQVLPQEKFEQLLELLFAKTKITRKWIKLHPEFYNHLFVSTQSYNKIKNQSAVFLIGRKGSGKSTVANTLPQLEYEKYKTCIPILADHINLLSTFELIDPDKVFNSTKADQKFRQFIEEITKLNPTQFLFKYAWLGLLYICLGKELCMLGNKKRLNREQQEYFWILQDEYQKFTFNQYEHIEVSKYFTLASVAFTEFWNDTITNALELDDFTKAFAYIESNVNEENYLRYLLSERLLHVIRKIVSCCDRYALITLDDFDSIFSMFRKSIKRNETNVQGKNFSKYLETSWVQALMILILELKGFRKGWHDKLFDKLDFCITIPKDSYAQVLSQDRDAFLDIECTADLDWTGVTLAQMLLKRLCYIYDESYDDGRNVFLELNRVIRTFSNKIPSILRFNFNNKNITIDLFCYVLRHTFWRPRDILTYYAALMTASLSCQDIDTLTVDQIRQIVGVTTRKIIKTEFIGEFNDIITNLEKIIDKFRQSPQILKYKNIKTRLNDIAFSIISRGYITDLHEKLKLLYEIGFIGLLLPKFISDEENTTTRECFYFNEGSRIFNSMMKYSFEDCDFIIHPIFVEYLRINHKNNDFILNWDEEYLRINHLVRVAVLDAFE